MSTDDLAGIESTGTTIANAASKSKRTIDWEGPSADTDACGDPTGYTSVRCPDRGVEVFTSGRRQPLTAKGVHSDE